MEDQILGRHGGMTRISGGGLPHELRSLIDNPDSLCVWFCVRAADRKTQEHRTGDKVMREVTVHPVFAALSLYREYNNYIFYIYERYGVGMWAGGFGSMEESGRSLPPCRPGEMLGLNH